MFTSKQILAFAAVATLIATVMELFFAASRSEASESRRLYEAALWNSPDRSGQRMRQLILGQPASGTVVAKERRWNRMFRYSARREIDPYLSSVRRKHSKRGRTIRWPIDR